MALAIQEGAHPKAIQERLGHSPVMVTLDGYGHLYQAWTAIWPTACMRCSENLAA